MQTHLRSSDAEAARAQRAHGGRRAGVQRRVQPLLGTHAGAPARALEARLPGAHPPVLPALHCSHTLCTGARGSQYICCLEGPEIAGTGVSQAWHARRALHLLAMS